MFRSVVLDDRIVRSAMTIILLMLAELAVTTAVGALYGYDFLSSRFEAASVVGNVGLSAGILVMWAGRLEFMSVFVLIGYIYAGVRGR